MEIVLWKKVKHLFQVKIKNNLISYRLKLFFHLGNYNEKLRIIDFPVYVSGKNDPNLTPLVPVN
jgi:hypothetical protein